MASPRASLETLPRDVLALIHIEANNVHLAEVSTILRTSLSRLQKPSIADFYIRRYRNACEAEHVLTLALKHPIVDYNVVRFIIERSPAQNAFFLPPRLDPSKGKVHHANRPLLRYILDHVSVAQRYRLLLEGAVERGDLQLAAQLFHMGAKVHKKHVLMAIKNNNTKMVKILCQHPLRPHRRRQNRGIILCPRLLFEAMNKPDVAAYFAAVLALERRHRHLQTRASFDADGKFVRGHNIGVKTT